MANANGPVERINLGFVSVSIWRNAVSREDGTERFFLSATPARNYRDGRGEWASSHSFTVSEMPTAIAAMKLALAYMVEREGYASAREDVQ